MLDPARYQDFCREFSFVEKTIEVWVTLKSVGGSRCIRIEALHTPGSTTPYTVKSYIDLSERSTSSGMRWTWESYDLPSILTAKSADEAIAQALSWLRDRCETC